MSGTSWLLGGGNPWRSADPPAILLGEQPMAVASPGGGLSLATLPGGSLGLASPDGSLGQLTLPRGVALDGDALFVLSQDGSLVYRYDALREDLVPLAHVGAHGLREGEAAYREARRFRHASAIAAERGALYVADPQARRIQVFDERTTALLRIHNDIGTPLDLCAAEGVVYVLVRERARVYRIAPDCDAPELVVNIPPAAPDCGSSGHSGEDAPRFDRLAVDAGRRLYARCRCGSLTVLEVFDLSKPLPVSHPSEVIFDSGQVRDRFVPPAVVMDSQGVLTPTARLLDPCGLRRPISDTARCWAVDDRFYLADPASRALHVLFADGRLRHRFGPLDANGDQVAPDSTDAWSPSDVAALERTAVILDARYRRIYVHRVGESALRFRFTAPADAQLRWSRIAVDAGGCLLLWDGASDRAERYTIRGEARAIAMLRDVRGLFGLARGRPPVRPSVLLTRSGARPRPEKPAPVWPAARYQPQATWISEWLDSGMHDCRWHVVQLSVRSFPPGSSLLVRTRTSNDPGDTETTAAGPPESWDPAPPFIAPAQPAPGATTRFDSDVLILSGQGRYLQLQIDLGGNGVDNPVIDHVRIRFPRDSLLDYLPTLYSTVPQQREFLDRLLSIAQTTWSAIEYEVENFQRYVDPDSVPAKNLAFLARWLDVRLEGSWRPGQNRRLLQAIPDLRRKWGTVEGVRAWTRIYLANVAGVDESALEQLGVPGIVEGFVERRQLLLGDASAALGAAQPLWSPAMERRFQLGVFDRLGDVELVSTGDPQSDVLRHRAHTFRIYVPATLVRTPDDEAKVRRAIEAQKPAHASYELVLVEPRLRVGVQSTIALDTVIGGPLNEPLVCGTTVDAPSRPPYQRLGYDTVLGAGSESDECLGLTRVLT